MKSLFSIGFEYEWKPFSIGGQPFCFAHKSTTRLERDKCSHWGPPIYKWEGKIVKGPFRGRLGILIGETDDLRARINQYATGTQPTGNKYWRTEFLECGDSYLHILECSRFELAGGTVVPISEMLNFKNGRFVLEQLLVLEERHNASDDKWIVSKWE